MNSSTHEHTECSGATYMFIELHVLLVGVLCVAGHHHPRADLCLQLVLGVLQTSLRLPPHLHLLLQLTLRLSCNSTGQSLSLSLTLIPSLPASPFPSPLSHPLFLSPSLSHSLSPCLHISLLPFLPLFLALILSPTHSQSLPLNMLSFNFFGCVCKILC